MSAFALFALAVLAFVGGLFALGLPDGDLGAGLWNMSAVFAGAGAIVDAIRYHSTQLANQIAALTPARATDPSAKP
jgi:hypothetical protein